MVLLEELYKIDTNQKLGHIAMEQISFLILYKILTKIYILIINTFNYIKIFFSNKYTYLSIVHF